MKRLLSIELQKIWLNKSSRTLCIAYFLILSLMALVATINIHMGAQEYNLNKIGIFDFPYIWHFNTYIAAIAKLFFAIVIVSMISNEYSYGTLKQNLIDGLSKKEFILSKFVTIVFFSLCATAFVFLGTLMLGYYFSPDTKLSVAFTDLQYIVAFFVKLLGFFSFCLFLGILVKRSAFALGFLLIWTIIETMLKLLLGLALHTDVNKAKAISGLLPLESMSNLIVEPFSRAYLAGMATYKDYSVHPGDILIVLGWTILFLYLSYNTLNNRDL